MKWYKRHMGEQITAVLQLDGNLSRDASARRMDCLLDDAKRHGLKTAPYLDWHTTCGQMMADAYRAGSEGWMTRAWHRVARAV